MQLLECIVSKPGLLNNIKFNFDKSLTIIYGKNESGKTLISKALIDTLLGEFSEGYALNGRAWDDMRLELLFINSKGKYRFIKNKKDSFSINFADLETSFGGNGNGREKQILQKNASDGKDGDATWPVKLFELTNDRETTRLLNKIDLQTFMNISYLPNPVDIAVNEQISYNTIKKFLLDDNSNFYSLFEVISESCSNEKMLNINNSISGEILKKETELKKINRQIQIFDIQNSKADRLFKEKSRLEQELNDFNRELTASREHKAKLINIQNNLKNLEDIHLNINYKNKEKEAEQEKMDSVYKMEEDIKQRYPQFYNFEEINLKNLKKIQETYREVRDVHEDIENFYLLRNAKKNKFKNIILFINIASIVFLAALFGISNFAFPILLLNEFKIQFIIASLSLSISSSLLFLLYYILSLRSNDLKQIMKKKSAVEKKFEEILQSNSITLNEYKLEAIYEYLVKYFEEYGEYSINQTELSNLKMDLKGESYLNTIDSEIEELTGKGNAINQEIDNDLYQLKDSGLTIEDVNSEEINKLIQSKNQKIKNLKEEISQATKIINHTDDEISRCSLHIDEIKTLNEEKTSIIDAVKRLNSYKNSFEYVLTLLKEAMISREDKLLAEISKTACEYFHSLTDNQYSALINEEIIKKILKGEMHSDEQKSILHTLFLSIKLAITNSFDELEINLPMIMDEPFLQMDDERIRRFKKILENISPKRQIVIFTHNSKIKDWGLFVEL